MTYLFYDIETSGLNKCFDQVVQFAAISTDLEFNELERYNIFVKLNPDTVPSPGAFITHQISLSDLQNFGICELEAMKKIHQLLNTPGTISLGYNSLGFDDEFLRFSFYRNLLPPYTHQYANQCGRMDLYPMVVLYYLFKNEILKWPERANAISLKLEFLSALNGLHGGIAHDALSDTEGVVELAKRLASDREMWDYIAGFFDKNIDKKRMSELPIAWQQEGQQYSEGIVFEGVFGAKNYFQCPVLGLGWHNHYQNQSLWLKLDTEKLVNLTSTTIPASFDIIYRKKVGECGFLLPPNERFSRYLTDERRQRVAENKLWIEKNPQLFAELVNYHREYKYPIVPNIDIDAALYQNNFRSKSEEAWCRRFHAVDLKDKINLLNNVPSENLKNQAIRVLGRNYREVLQVKIGAEFDLYLAKIKNHDTESIPIDYRSRKHLTLSIALKELIELKKNKDLDTKQLDLLGELENFLTY